MPTCLDTQHAFILALQKSVERRLMLCYEYKRLGKLQSTRIDTLEERSPAMAKRKTLKRKAIYVPADIHEANEVLMALGQAERDIETVNTRLNTSIEALKAAASAKIKPVQELNDERLLGLFAFAEANRGELTDEGKKKTVTLPTGTLAWRMTPPAVSLRGVKEILAELKARRLRRFIRVKLEVDKEAMLKEPKAAEKVPGVTISQREEFVVKPAETDAEVTGMVDKLKKATRE